MNDRLYYPHIDPAYCEADPWRVLAQANSARVGATLPIGDDPNHIVTPATAVPATARDNAPPKLQPHEPARPSRPAARQGPAARRGSPKRPMHIKRVVDMKGVERWYYSRGGKPFIRLTGRPGSAEFEDGYRLAIHAKRLAWRATLKPKEPVRSIRRLAQLYFESEDFRRLRPATRKAYRRVIERMVRDPNFGPRDAARIGAQSIRSLIVKRKHAPASAQDAVKKLRLLMRLAIRRRWRGDDPTLAFQARGGGERRPWTEDEVARFEARWPIGSRERTAFALLLTSGKRNADVVRTTQIELGRREACQAIGERDTGVHGQPKMLTTRRGDAFTPASIGNFMASAIRAAGLLGCTADGLRRTRKSRNTPQREPSKCVCKTGQDANSRRVDCTGGNPNDQITNSPNRPHCQARALRAKPESGRATSSDASRAVGLKAVEARRRHATDVLGQLGSG